MRQETLDTMSWFESLPPAETAVPCGSGTHIVRWGAGQLTLPAHPDAEAELVLGALGGEKPACVALTEIWARHAADLTVLATGPRCAADTVSISWDQVAEQRASLPGGWPQAVSAPAVTMPTGSAPGKRARRLHYAAAGPGIEEARRRQVQRIELLELLALGTGFQFRLTGTVIAAWVEPGRADERAAHRPALTAALTGRFAPAARDWLGIDPDAVTVTPHEGPGWGTLAVTGARAGRRLRASLPAGWLADVWACGMAVASGYLVVAVEEPGYPLARVLALPAPDAEPVAIAVRAAGEDPAGLPAWEVAGGLRATTMEAMGDQDLVTRLSQAGVGRGDLVGLAVAPDGTAAVATADEGWVTSATEVALADHEVRPRWVTWSQESAQQLVAGGVRLATCWDVAAVHRLVFGGWRADPGWVWARLRGLPLDTVPSMGLPQSAGEADLFDAAHEHAEEPAGPDGYLRPEWTRGGWATTTARLLVWARLARQAAELQGAVLTDGDGGAMRVATARSESTVELLCAELSADGLPMDRVAAERVLAGIIGPRPRGEAEAAAMRAARDSAVLRHAPAGVTADLRSPAQVRSLLATAGIEVPDTRAWRLEEFRGSHPLVAELLEWRKAERIATTYGYAWLDEHLGSDGRLRGAWTGSDGAAGRMTASNGLHNMPAAMREAVIAADNHIFIRADLGQIEPRVLATVSGDPALAAATQADDMYLPVASELGVDRPTAKVAMIAAMYGQTTGHGGQAGRRMRAAYPVAMAYLDSADRSARAGRALHTYGGRLIPMSAGGAGGASGPPGGIPAGSQAPRADAARVAARGRYGRNALIQGAAAELFKMWAVTVRARGFPLGAAIVLCLHDELLVHAPADHAEETAALVGDCLAETARRWAPGGRVRFIADISVVRSWSDAKLPVARELPEGRGW